MADVSSIARYFPQLSNEQKNQLEALYPLYQQWNQQINVISRKDIEELYERHVLHSLAIAKYVQFEPNAQVLDIGTGGGFPGVPLAIMFPKTQFHLVDSIGKKIKVVEEVSKALQLINLTASHQRAENIKDKFDFIVTRAVAPTPQLVEWVKDKTKKQHNHPLKNGLIALKGGDLTEELKDFPKAKITPISQFFEEPFFAEKDIVYVPFVK